MAEAIEMAKIGESRGEVPIGAVIVRGNEIIAKEHNRVEELRDPSAHCEHLAIRSACATLGEKYLMDCDLYVTLEPCPMCAGAIVLSKLKRVIFGAMDYKAGACGSLYMIASDKRLNHRAEVISGIMQNECSELLINFFTKLRLDKTP